MPGDSSDDDDLTDGVWFADPDVPDEERDFPFYICLQDVRYLHLVFLLHAAHCLLCMCAFLQCRCESLFVLEIIQHRITG